MPQIKELEKHPEVCVVGEVDDVRPYVLSADVAIAPLQIARGIQNKVLEALACGKPVIATSNAAAGIDQQGGLFIANEPEEWVETLRSLQCQKRHAEASHQARNGVMTQYSWSARLTPLLEMLQLQQPSFTSID
jgi:glycosyltransferase involved in cell wall biosynthesis